MKPLLLAIFVGFFVVLLNILLPLDRLRLDMGSDLPVLIKEDFLEVFPFHNQELTVLVGHVGVGADGADWDL